MYLSKPRDVSMEICFMLDTVFAGRVIKGQVALYSVKAAYLKGYLKRVIVTGFEDSIVNPSIIYKSVPLGRYINIMLHNLNRHSPIDIPTRMISERLFDKFSSRKIPDCDIFYSQPPIWTLSMQRAMRNNSILAVRDSAANPNYVLKIAKEELRYYNKKVNSYFLKKGKLYNKGVKQSDWIFACSEYSKTTQIEEGIPEDKIIVAGIGVDTKRFHPPKKPYEGDFSGIFIGGSVRPLKGIRYLLEAWNGFSKRNEELVVCGNIEVSVNSLFQYYKNKINVITPGFIDPANYYRNASIFIYPSLTDAFGKVIFEALSSGLPVITTTNTGGYGIIKNGREGFVVPIKDAKSIMNYIMYFKDNPSEIKRMGRNARRLAERHTWEIFSKRMCRFFEIIYESGRNR